MTKNWKCGERDKGNLKKKKKKKKKKETETAWTKA